MGDRERLLRIAQVAEWIGVSENTLRYWRQLAQGDHPQSVGPPSAKFGKRIVYRESDVQAWIDAQFEKATG
ncbi:helix-turn-helix transcriptional regulator [Nocardioides nitrophenolicus]|uniref:helix-turn-helix transcriptional regulator n=1 Tax=Nocardioides nitrophenolicus TaxID=60489 RepID=UPI000AC57E6D|nr:helix-turn-helix domain-containing protein [Nocardioides nitrophenolicus]MBM7518303.1 putative DNA-binding transcriptional regulator AlpA [Nocardioides nitrophenolicus]